MIPLEKEILIAFMLEKLTTINNQQQILIYANKDKL